ncbi:MAG TPA: hypothetical protein VFA33_01110 [Bryobacteraceae bacterium]|nr:hypothetical protein [Bryobacteraceae bacterium]
MPTTIDELIQANQKSIEALESAEELIESNKDSLPTAEQFVALTIISDIDTRLRVLKFTQVHLGASQVVVDFNADEQNKLAEMESQLDGFIAADSQIESVLNSVPAILNAVVRIDGMINGHIAHA